MSNSLMRLVSFIQFLTEKTQGEIADSINYTRSHFNVLIKKGSNPEMEKMLTDKYRKQIDQFFAKAGDSVIKVKSTGGPEEKIVDSEQVIMVSSLQIKAMLRVVLRNQASIISAQQKVPESEILEKITKAVNEESQANFDSI